MMSDDEKIIIVVVTYNRKSLLRKNILSLLAQSRLPDTIIVVDNASTDGTKDLLQKEFPNHPLLSYLKLDKNIGGAGGFHHGLRLAVEMGADWICLMDDDCYPHKDCIRQLMINIDDNRNIYSPIILSDDNKSSVLWGIDAAVRTGNLEIVTLPFNGLLIHKDTVKDIGYPDKRFFIYGDDADYNFRARLSGRKVIMVTDSVIYHPLKNTLQGLNIIKLFMNKHWVYYKLRNAIVVSNRYGYFSARQFVMLLASLFFHMLTLNFKFIKLWIDGLKDGINKKMYVRDFDI